MSLLTPFRALRPAPDAAPRVASVPYDVVSAAEARQLVSDNPLSFLRVTRSEVDLPAGTHPYDASVYDQAVANFEALKQSAPMVLEDEPSLYFYQLKTSGRLTMGTHVQAGLCGCFSLDEYDRGLIKKHERTRKDKEDDRTRHITELRAQTGVVFLTYRASAAVDAIAGRVCAGAPLYDFTASDGILHTIWRVAGDDVNALVRAYGELPALYIADGHHRAASAARARASLRQMGGRTTDADTFIAVAFPDRQLKILPYNRVVKDLAGHTPETLLAALRTRVAVTDGGPAPARANHVSMFLAGRWYSMTLPVSPPGTPRVDTLAVAVLQREVLEPVFGIGDVRVDPRVEFVGGARGTAELEALVRSGLAAAAFSLFPVSVDDLLQIADAGGIMPPKSTWFEPKLRDGLLVHLI